MLITDQLAALRDLNMHNEGLNSSNLSLFERIRNSFVYRFSVSNVCFKYIEAHRRLLKFGDRKIHLQLL